MGVWETKLELEVFELNLLAYPDSADALTKVADAYFSEGQTDLVRQHAEKAQTSWILRRCRCRHGPIRDRTAVSLVDTGGGCPRRWVRHRRRFLKFKLANPATYGRKGLRSCAWLAKS